MKKITLVFTNGNKATYDKTEIENLEYVYRMIKKCLDEKISSLSISTDDMKHKTLINISNLVGVDVMY